MFKHILTVCVGNICRSPTAEILLREALAPSGFQVESAGLGALVDKPIEPSAACLLHDRGHDSIDHRARQITRPMLHSADLILVMERPHIEHILTLAPEVRGKVFLLGKWQNDREIADPYRRGDDAFSRAYNEIAEAVSAWVARIKR